MAQLMVRGDMENPAENEQRYSSKIDRITKYNTHMSAKRSMHFAARLTYINVINTRSSGICEENVTITGITHNPQYSFQVKPIVVHLLKVVRVGVVHTICKHWKKVKRIRR